MGKPILAGTPDAILAGMAAETETPLILYFVRHGVTEPNSRGMRCGGDNDVPMMDEGCDQVLQLARQIRSMNLGIGVIVTGSLIRTKQTAHIISAVLGDVPIEIEPLVNERRLGEWNQRTIAETEDLLKQKATPPGGESETEFSERIGRAVESLRKFGPRTPLVVSSKGVGRILHALAGGEGRMQVGNAEIVKFEVPALRR
jgi:probable phosphoglycerate mutase